ncbi:bcl-2-related ovarian killer protein isoform X3 [Balaenoptera acutorostrata]|uniref:Bcl-2-related ovarian killer protein isoform X3 n=1 Tax=Balaenoptera acutorostrata TaxID=9767 RepID=A0ABM3TZH6_BALAC|nr:bcl-2-related ovarian killer protein isoform X3 [Balaenoptera acutorostrata]
MLPPCLCCFLRGLRRGTHVCVLSQVVPGALQPSSSSQLPGCRVTWILTLPLGIFSLIDYNLHLVLIYTSLFISEGTLYDWQALFPRLSFVCLSSQESPGARSCPCTQWLRGWPWTACDRPSPPWSTPSWTASGSSCARRWRPGCGDAVDGRMCSSAWSAPTPASARTGSWPRSAASAAS